MAYVVVRHSKAWTRIYEMASISNVGQRGLRILEETICADADTTRTCASLKQAQICSELKQAQIGSERTQLKYIYYGSAEQSYTRSLPTHVP